jgi:hypothetical protein
VRDLSKCSLTRDLPFSPVLYLFLPIGVNDFFLDSFLLCKIQSRWGYLAARSGAIYKHAVAEYLRVRRGPSGGFGSG